MSKITFFVPFLLTSLLCSGCTTVITPAPPPISAAPERKISIPIGIYYSPEFSGFTYVRQSGKDTFITEIGKSSVNLLDQVFSKVLDNAIYIDKLPPYKSTDQDVSLIIEPMLEDFDHLLGLEKGTDRKSITYRFNFYNPNGVPVSSWTIIGNAKKHWWNAPPVWSHIARDMHDAGTKLLSQLVHEVEAYKRKTRGYSPLTDNKYASERRMQVDIKVVPQATFTRQTPVHIYRDVGVIALSVTFTNNEKREVLVHDSYFRLRIDKDRLVAPINSHLIVGRLPNRGGKSSLVEGVSAGAASAARKVTRGVDTVSKTMNVLGPVTSVIAESKRWDALQFDARKNVGKIGKRILKQGDTVSGMLFFLPAKGTKAFNDADLVIWIQYPETKVSFRLVVPVKGLNYIADHPVK